MKNFLFTVLLILSVCMRAANFDVNNTNDTGPGTLKFCISQANGTPGRDTITFNPSTNGNIITFWTEGIDITESVVIIGNGVLQTQVAGNFADTLFVIKNYADTIYFKDLWLSAGSPSIVSHYGLGSSLKFERCRLWNGTGTIYYQGDGMLSLLDCDLSNGSSCYISGGQAFHFERCSFDNFTSSALYITNYSGDLFIKNCTFYGNYRGVQMDDPQSGYSAHIWHCVFNASSAEGLYVNETHLNGSGIQLYNNIIYGNGTADFYLIGSAGSNPTQDKNIVGTTNSSYGSPTWYSNSNPFFDASGLQDNGGHCKTIALTSSSANCINQANNVYSPLTDARGNARIGNPDIGAYEYNPCTGFSAASYNAQEPDCFGLSNGSATVTPTGGLTPYTYLWSSNAGSATTQSVSGLASGSYSCVVQDFNGCLDTLAFVLGEPSALMINGNSYPETCPGACNGWADVMVTGGTPNYSYYWQPVNQFSSTASFLCAGTYTCDVVDGNGCTASYTATVISPSSMTVTVNGTNITCNGAANGTATVTVSGGNPPYSYSWSPLSSNSSIVTNIPTGGTYSVFVSDINGCNSTGAITITEPNLLQANATIVSLPGCNLSNGALQSFPSGGTPPYRYRWSNGDTTNNPFGISSGAYLLDVTDANGCTTSELTNLYNNSGPTVSFGSTTHISCVGADDGSVSATVTGGTPPYFIYWSDLDTSNHSLVRNNLQPGPYDLYARDANGCLGLASTTVLEPAELTNTFGYSFATCGLNDGSVFATVSGGSSPYTYQWSSNAGSATTFSVTSLSAGVYTLTVTDANGCVKTFPAFLSNATSMYLTGNGDTTNCGSNNGTINLKVNNAMGPFIYLWSNGDTNEDPVGLAPGNYYVSVTDLNTSCVAIAPFKVEFATKLLDPTVCMTLVDTADDRNIIVWERPSGITGIKDFKIFRETSKPGIYRHIGTSPFANLTQFKDTIADADLHGWKYKISAFDSCGIETGRSIIEHRPIHLTTDTTVSGDPYLTWTAYMGRPYSDYVIWRNHSSTGWIAIDTVPVPQQYFTDFACPAGYVEYYIEAVFQNTCNATRAPINTTRSNIKGQNRMSNGIKQITSGQIKLYPNPATESLVIEISEKLSAETRIYFYDAIGREVLSAPVSKSDTKINLDISALNKGVYIVKIVSNDGQSNFRLIKQ